MNANIPSVSIFGVPVSKLDKRDTLRVIVEAIKSRKPHQVITANPIMIMAAQDRPEYMAMMRRADLIVPDGTGVVWAANYIRNPVAEKVAGIELVQELIPLARDNGWRIYLLGAAPDVIHAAAERISAQYPGICIVGVRDGYFTDVQDEEVLADIQAVKPDILFVGRSSDGQEPWIDRYKVKLNVPLMMGVGGSFDILSGRLKRAPKLFIKLRLEWLYRLLKEPSRFKRMLVLPQFAIKIIRERENVQK